MPLQYQIDLQYVYNTEYWTNKWYVNATDLLNARDSVLYLAGLLAGNMPPSATVQKGRITPMPFVKNAFTDIVLNMPGQAGWQQPAPLFNVVRMDFAATTGRATHHYMRALFPPAAIGSNQQFTTEWQGYNHAVAEAFGDCPAPIVNIHGFAYATYTASPQVGMRQLRRGSKRRTQPII